MNSRKKKRGGKGGEGGVLGISGGTNYRIGIAILLSNCLVARRKWD